MGSQELSNVSWNREVIHCCFTFILQGPFSFRKYKYRLSLWKTFYIIFLIPESITYIALSCQDGSTLKNSSLDFIHFIIYVNSFVLIFNNHNYPFPCVILIRPASFLQKNPEMLFHLSHFRSWSIFLPTVMYLYNLIIIIMSAIFPLLRFPSPLKVSDCKRSEFYYYQLTCHSPPLYSCLIYK